MSIERSQPSRNDNTSTRDVDRSRDRPKDKVRDQPEPELVDRFRTALQARGGEQKEMKLDLHLAEGQEGMEHLDGGKHTSTAHAVVRKQDDGDTGQQQQQSGGDGLPPAELAALYQAQLQVRDVPMNPVAPPPPSTTPQALADMLERHVRQLAISAEGARADDGQVLLRLADRTLPGTDLLLSRTDKGWLLRADVRSRGSYEAILQAAPQLAERFASRNLGQLEIDSHYTG